MTNIELIEALEKAEGPSRELDARLAVATNENFRMVDEWPKKLPRDNPYVQKCFKEGKYVGRTRWGTVGNVTAPLYTASIDAALTLMSNDWEWELSNDTSTTDLDDNPCTTFYFKLGENIEAESNACPAIAICIAALRAREIDNES